jgi:tetratricopeptide (TPR) repeat protein
LQQFIELHEPKPRRLSFELEKSPTLKGNNKSDLKMNSLKASEIAFDRREHAKQLIREILKEYQSFGFDVKNEDIDNVSLTSLLSNDSLQAAYNERFDAITTHDNLKTVATNDAMIADILNNLAACNEVLGRVEDARCIYEESLQLRMVVHGKSSLKAAESMQNLATILNYEGNLKEAKEYLIRALNILIQELGRDHIETAVAMNNLGVLHAQLQEFDEAKRMLEASIIVRKHTFGDQHHLTRSAQQNLDQVLSKIPQRTEFTDIRDL